MIFHCLKCNTKYRIDDEKLLNKVLRFSCRTCGVSLLIRDPSWGSPSVYLDIKQHSNIRRTTKESGRLSTIRIETKQFKELKGDEMIKSQAPVQTKEVWFAIRKGERIGPLTKRDLLEMLLSGKLHDKSFVWRPTMKNWMRMNTVEELRELLMDALGVPPTPSDAMTNETSVQSKSESSILSKDLFKSLTGETSVSAWLEKEEKRIDGSDVVGDSCLSKGLFETLTGETSVTEWTPPAEKADKKEDGETARLAKEPLEQEIYRGLFPSVTEERGEKPKEEISEKILISSLKPVKEAKLSSKEVKNLVREFSLMIRLKRKSRAAQILLVLGVLLLVGGLCVLYVLTSVEHETPERYREKGSKITGINRPLYPVTQEEAEKVEAEPVKKESTAKLSEILKKKTSSKKVEPADKTEEEEKPVPKVAEVDPALKEEYTRMAGLMPAIEKGKEEMKIDVKPEFNLVPQNQLSSDKIDTLLGNKLKKFSECRARKSINPDKFAKIVLTFTVNTEGRVTDVIIENESWNKDPELESCIRKIVSAWIFPPIEEAQTFKRSLLL